MASRRIRALQDSPWVPAVRRDKAFGQGCVEFTGEPQVGAPRGGVQRTRALGAEVIVFGMANQTRFRTELPPSWH